MRSIVLILCFLHSPASLADDKLKAQSVLRQVALTTAYGMLTQFTGPLAYDGEAEGLTLADSSRDEVLKTNEDFTKVKQDMLRRIYGESYIMVDEALKVDMFLDTSIMDDDVAFQQKVSKNETLKLAFSKMTPTEIGELRRIGKIYTAQRKSTSRAMDISSLTFWLHLKGIYDSLPWIENEADLKKFLDTKYAEILGKNFVSIAGSPTAEDMQQQAKDIAEVYQKLIVIFLQSCKTKTNLQKVIDSPYVTQYFEDFRNYEKKVQDYFERKRETKAKAAHDAVAEEDRQADVKLRHAEELIRFEQYVDSAWRARNLVRIGTFVGIAATVVAAITGHYELAAVFGTGSGVALLTGSHLLYPNRTGVMNALKAKAELLKAQAKPREIETDNPVSPVSPKITPADIIGDLDLSLFSNGFEAVAMKARKGVKIKTQYGVCDIGKLSAMIADATQKFSSCGIAMTADELVNAFQAQGVCSH